MRALRHHRQLGWRLPLHGLDRVRVARELEPPKTARTLGGKTTETDGTPALNDRQTWILEQLDLGVELRHKDIVRHTRKNRSNISWDLKELRYRGQIETHPDWYYVRTSRR